MTSKEDAAIGATADRFIARGWRFILRGRLGTETWGAIIDPSGTEHLVSILGTKPNWPPTPIEFLVECIGRATNMEKASIE